MTDIKYINGTDVVFYSDNSDVITLKASFGKTLVIEGYSSGGGGAEPVGIDGSIQYKTGTLLDGQNDFTYSSVSKTLDVNKIITNEISNQIETDARGDNELSTIQNLEVANTSIYENQGISVAITDNNVKTRIALGAPKYNLFTSDGGVITYESINNANFGGSVPYRASTFCDDFIGEYTDINEDGSFFCTSLGIKAVNMHKYNTLTGVYSYAYPIYDFKSGKVSGNNVLLSNLSSNLAVYTYNGSSWIPKQTITSGGIGIFDIVGTKLYFYKIDTLYTYELISNTWTQDGTILLPEVNKMAVKNNLLVLSTSTNIFIYENLILSGTLSISSMSALCTNGTYIFYSTTSAIYVISKVLGVWTFSTNSTLSGNISGMACNFNRLVVSKRYEETYGKSYVYNINSYTNSFIPNNKIDLIDDINIESIYKNISLKSTNIILDGNVNIVGSVGIQNSFKMSAYRATATQSVASITTVTVLWPLNLEENITGLTKSTHLTGTKFQSDRNLLLLVTYSLRCSTSASSSLTYIRVNDNSFYFGQSSSTPASSGSSIIKLSTGDFFTTNIVLTANGTLNDITSSELQIYSLI